MAVARVDGQRGETRAMRSHDRGPRTGEHAWPTSLFALRLFADSALVPTSPPPPPSEKRQREGQRERERETGEMFSLKTSGL